MDTDSLYEVICQCGKDGERWFPGVAASESHHIIALMGELGEFANLWKKVERGSLTREETLEELRAELTDVFIYLAGLAYLLKMDLGAYYARKREFNEDRFGSFERPARASSEPASCAAERRDVNRDYRHAHADPSSATLGATELADRDGHPCVWDGSD